MINVSQATVLLPSRYMTAGTIFHEAPRAYQAQPYTVTSVKASTSVAQKRHYRSSDSDSELSAVALIMNALCMWMYVDNILHPYLHPVIETM